MYTFKLQNILRLFDLNIALFVMLFFGSFVCALISSKTSPKYVGGRYNLIINFIWSERVIFVCVPQPDSEKSIKTIEFVIK